MANRFKGEISVTCDGVRYTLRMDLGTMAAFESETGVDALEWAQKAEEGEYKIGDMITMIHLSLQRHHEGASRVIASDIISEDLDTLQRLFAAASPDVAPAPEGAPAGNGTPAATG